ncbi:MAG TPA: AI-2E family transporter [Acidimicrobiales bacterium]|nr:AI-2E family transporter [Acidimicrobiales bacterium]
MTTPLEGSRGKGDPEEEEPPADPAAGDGAAGAASTGEPVPPEPAVPEPVAPARVEPAVPEPVAPGPVAVTGEGRGGMPRWLPRGILLFWSGLVVLVVLRWLLGKTRGLLIVLLVSLFLSVAIEPGVNRLARRGWRRGSATGLVLIAVFLAFVVLVGAVGTLVGQQIADLLTNSERYVNQVVDFINDNFGQEINPEDVMDEINDPDGAVQRFIQSQADEALRLSVQFLGFLLQVLSVILFTFYLVADGPKLRRAICSRLPEDRQLRVLEAWNLAIEKTGGYLYSRGILAILSAFFHGIVFWILDLPASIALAIWVGIVSQFLPVIGTYLAGLLPVLVALVEDPTDVIVVLIAVVVYQQIENYLFLPRITARTLDLHPAVAFGSALFGAAILGAPGAILALPFAATLQAFAAQYGAHHDVIDDELTRAPPSRDRRRRWFRRDSA